MLVQQIFTTMLMTGLFDVSIGRVNCQVCKNEVVEKVLFLRIFLFILEID